MKLGDLYRNFLNDYFPENGVTVEEDEFLLDQKKFEKVIQELMFEEKMHGENEEYYDEDE